MGESRESKGRSRPALVFLILLASSGLVLAFSFLIAWPPVVFYTACLVGLLTLIGVVVLSYRDSRRDDTSIMRSTGHSLADGARFLRDFL